MINKEYLIRHMGGAQATAWEVLQSTGSSFNLAVQHWILLYISSMSRQLLECIHKYNMTKSLKMKGWCKCSVIVSQQKKGYEHGCLFIKDYGGHLRNLKKKLTERHKQTTLSNTVLTTERWNALVQCIKWQELREAILLDEKYLRPQIKQINMTYNPILYWKTP